MSSAAKPTLTYYNGRGLAEVIRLVLAEAGVEYIDHRLIDTDDDKDFLDFKATGVLPFGQVPFYKQGNLELSQSAAIARYVAKTHNLYGKTPEEAAMIDMVLDAINTDLRPAQRQYGDSNFTEDKKAELKKKFLGETLPRFVGHFEKLLAKNGGFVAGNTISLGDIVLYYYFTNNANEFGPALEKALDGAPHLKALIDRVAHRPNIAKWVAQRPNSDW